MSPTNHFGAEELQPWTLARIYDDLVSYSELAERLNVRPTRLTGWLVNRERTQCPRPIKRIGHIDIYSLAEWVDWYSAWQESHKTYKSFKGFKPHPQNAAKVRALWGSDAIESDKTTEDNDA